MPNWTYNELKSSKPGFFKKFLDEKGNFDFNTLIPMPKSLDIEAGSKTTQAIIVSITGVDLLKPCTAEEYHKVYSSDLWLTDKDIDLRIQRLKTMAMEDREILFKMGLQYRKNIEQYGFCTWYEWCWAKWGTKWNACDTVLVDDQTVSFDTAWCEPLPIFKRLATEAALEDVIFSAISESEDGRYAEYESDEAGTLSIIEEGEYCYNEKTEENDYVSFGSERRPA